MTVTNLRAERDRRKRGRIVADGQRRRHAADVRRQDRQDRERRASRRAVANAAGGCLTSITATLAVGLAVVAVVWKAGRR